MPITQQASKALDTKELNQALPQLLIDILKEPFNYDPILFAKSSQTTDVFASKAEETRQALATVVPKLTHIIPCPNLVQQLAPELTEALKDVWVQPGDRLSIRVDSKYTTAPLTRAIHSEKDSEDIFLGLYLYPALSLIGFLKAREKLEKGDPWKKHTNDEIMDYKELQSDIDFKLYAASFGGANHIADLGVYELLSNDKSVLHLAIEIKTPVAFPKALLNQVSPRTLSAGAADPHDYDMDEADMKKIEGWAIQFNWPGRDQNFGSRQEMKHNKVISQVWNQMVKHKKRKDLRSGHLYISPPCCPHEDGLVDIVAWTLKAAGYLKGDINVPTVVTSWWNGLPKSNQPGINERTLPHEALLRYNKDKLKTRRRKNGGTI